MDKLARIAAFQTHLKLSAIENVECTAVADDHIELSVVSCDETDNLCIALDASCKLPEYCDGLDDDAFDECILENVLTLAERFDLEAEENGLPPPSHGSASNSPSRFTSRVTSRRVCVCGRTEYELETAVPNMLEEINQSGLQEAAARFRDIINEGFQRELTELLRARNPDLFQDEPEAEVEGVKISELTPQGFTVSGLMHTAEGSGIIWSDIEFDAPCQNPSVMQASILRSFDEVGVSV